MRIAIDATVLDRGMTGTGRYLYNILNELPNQDNINKYFLITGKELNVDRNFYTKIYHRQNIIPSKLYSPIWFNFVLPRILKKNNIDLLFAPNVLIPIVNLQGIKKIAVIHDVIPKVYPNYYPFFYKVYLTLFLQSSLKKSDKIITVSEFSKNDIIKHYGIAENKINVVYNTASENFYFDKSKAIKSHNFTSRLKLPQKYILFVGVIEKRKNITALMKILDILKEKGSKLKLVLVGRPGFDFSNLYKEICKRGNEIIHYKFLKDEDLLFVYKNSFAFIFPTFYEGFGIPPLEAMNLGIPVLSSNSSSMPEVVGNGGLMRDVNDYNGFAEDILKLENDEKFYSEMKLRAIKQSKKFNIIETTQKLVKIFNEYS